MNLLSRVKEEWRQIIGSPDGWLVSDSGKVQRYGRTIGHHHSEGYPAVWVERHGTRRKERIHRLVAEAFVLGWFDGAQVNHKDGNKDNNRAENLEWVSLADNNRHAVRTGLNPKTGVCHHGAVLNDAKVRVIRRLIGHGWSNTQVADVFGVARQTVNSVRRGRTWSHV